MIYTWVKDARSLGSGNNLFYIVLGEKTSVKRSLYIYNREDKMLIRRHGISMQCTNGTNKSSLSKHLPWN